MKILACLLILFSSLSLFAQAEFLDSQTPSSDTLPLPLKVGTSGDISFFSNPEYLMLGPLLGLAYSDSFVQYIQPEKISDEGFIISHPSAAQGWVEVRRHRYEKGLGLNATVGKLIAIGLLPFEGALQRTIRHKKFKDEQIVKDLEIPSDFQKLQDWSVGDQGSYQVYGGIEAKINARMSVINLAKTSVAFQNQFIVEIRKVDEHKITFSIAEENLKRTGVGIGPLISSADLRLFHGQRFKADFVLDLTNPLHFDLYQQGLKGKINIVQNALESREQRMSWLGYSEGFDIGIPYLIGIKKSHSVYDINTDGDESKIIIKNRQHYGEFVTAGEHQRIVYLADDMVHLLWNSKINKAHDVVMEKHFFRVARSLGIKGLRSTMPEGDYGSIQTQIGISFSPDDINILMEINSQKLGPVLQSECELLKLSCRHTRKVKALMKAFVKIKSLTANQLGLELGKLMMKHPVLLRSLLKSTHQSKEAYLKFLNNRYQSLEGMVPLEI